MFGPAWPGALVPFPLSANKVCGKLGRLTTPPQRPIGHSQESHLSASRARSTPGKTVSGARCLRVPNMVKEKAENTLLTEDIYERTRVLALRAGGVRRGPKGSSGRAFPRSAPLVPGRAPPRLLPTSGPRLTASTSVRLQEQMGDPQMVGEVRWPRRGRRPRAPHL